jgi:SAM-dependent methyltransferase
VAEVLPSGDPARIKALYTELGELLADAHGDDLGGAPVLSLAETSGVVAALLDGVVGLVLDAGCGPNPALAIRLVDPKRVVVALDIGFGTVRLACAVAEKAGARLEGVVGDLEALPFRSDAFAGCACDDTIEHLPDDGMGVTELARVVAPGGRVVIATPNRRSLAVVVAKARDRLARRRRPSSAYFQATSHLREYTWPDLEGLIRPALRVRTRAGVGWSGGWVHRLATLLTSRGPGRRLSRMVVVAAEPR